MVHARNITGYNDPLRKATKNHSEGCNVTKVNEGRYEGVFGSHYRWPNVVIR